jgi:hypothetical protein
MHHDYLREHCHQFWEHRLEGVEDHHLEEEGEDHLMVEEEHLPLVLVGLVGVLEISELVGQEVVALLPEVELVSMVGVL